MIKKDIKELLHKLSPTGYIVSLDLETTGIDKAKDKIIEIGAVKSVSYTHLTLPTNDRV